MGIGYFKEKFSVEVFKIKSTVKWFKLYMFMLYISFIILFSKYN